MVQKATVVSLNSLCENILRIHNIEILGVAAPRNYCLGTSARINCVSRNDVFGIFQAFAINAKGIYFTCFVYDMVLCGNFDTMFLFL